MKADETELNPFDGRVICDETCELGEGITYDALTDTAWWFDIKGQRLHEWHMSTETKRVYDTPFLGSALARIDEDRQLVVADSGLLIRDIKTDSYAEYRVLEANPLTRSNDSRMHQSGALWTSRMGRHAEFELGAIYHVDSNGSTLLFANMTIPNGICFSPDGAIAYFADSRANCLMRVSLDRETGLPTEGPSVLSDENGSPGCIDGAICDADGLIWSARWGEGSIDVHTPEGVKINRYAVPAPQVSCPAFVGSNASRIMVTSAWEDMKADTRARFPLSGSTFELGINVRGRHEPFFKI